MPKMTTARRLEAERAVLSVCLQWPSSVQQVIDEVPISLFAGEANRAVYAAVSGLAARNRVVNMSTVVDAIHANGNIEVATPAYVSDVASSVESPSTLAYFIGVMKEAHRVERYRDLGVWLAERAGGDVDTDELGREAESRLFSMTQDTVGVAEDGPIGLVADKCMEEIAERVAAGGVNAIGAEVGWRFLDMALLGFQPGALYILAARPSIGKTAMALTMLLKMAKRGVPQGFISCEMDRESLFYRLLALKTGIDMGRISLGRMHQDEFARVKIAAMDLRKLPIDLYYRPGVTPSQIRMRAARLKERMGLAVLWVDYLQIAHPDKMSGNREQDVASIARGFKDIAGEIGIALVGLSQLNRMLEHRKEKEPNLADLRESGEIENAADVVMFIHREKTEECGKTDMLDTKLIVAKQRNGMTGVQYLAFRPHLTEFVEKAETDAFDRG